MLINVIKISLIYPETYLIATYKKFLEEAYPNPINNNLPLFLYNK